jgi:hypothetical protein
MIAELRHVDQRERMSAPRGSPSCPGNDRPIWQGSGTPVDSLVGDRRPSDTCRTNRKAATFSPFSAPVTARRAGLDLRPNEDYGFVVMLRHMITERFRRRIRAPTTGGQSRRVGRELWTPCPSLRSASADVGTFVRPCIALVLVHWPEWARAVSLAVALAGSSTGALS